MAEMQSSRQAWLDGFYAELRRLIAEDHRKGDSGYEFMGYEVLPSAERKDDPSKIVIHTLEAGLPTTGASTYHGMMFSAALEESPQVIAQRVFDWLRTQPR